MPKSLILFNTNILKFKNMRKSVLVLDLFRAYLYKKIHASQILIVVWNDTLTVRSDIDHTLKWVQVIWIILVADFENSGSLFGVF